MIRDVWVRGCARALARSVLLAAEIGVASILVAPRAAAAAAAAQAEAEADERRGGVAFDVSFGAGVTQTSTFFGVYNGFGFAGFEADDVEFAWMVPALSLGLWAGPKLSLGGRVANFWYVADDGEVVNGFFGGELRFLPIDEVLLAGALGVQLVGETGQSDAGFGADLRAGYLPLELEGHRFGAFVEYVAGTVAGSFTYSAGAGVIWAGP